MTVQVHVFSSSLPLILLTTLLQMYMQNHSYCLTNNALTYLMFENETHHTCSTCNNNHDFVPLSKLYEVCCTLFSS